MSAVEGWGSYIVCSGVVAEGSGQGYEHVICLHVASEETVQGRCVWRYSAEGLIGRGASQGSEEVTVAEGSGLRS
jgi:hypothetical protein